MVVAMSRPRTVSDDELLAVARDLLLREGARVATGAIAAAVGLSQAAVFKRFGTKDGLIVAALAPKLPEEWLAQVQVGPGDGPVDDQLIAVLLGFHAIFAKVLPALAVMRDSGIDLHKIASKLDTPPPVRARKALTAWLAVAHAQGRLDAPEPEPIAMALLSSVQARCFMHHMMGDAAQLPPVEPYVETVVRQFWRGMAPRSEER